MEFLYSEPAIVLLLALIEKKCNDQPFDVEKNN